jgi:hypothetical protein
VAAIIGSTVILPGPRSFLPRVPASQVAVGALNSVLSCPRHRSLDAQKWRSIDCSVNQNAFRAAREGVFEHAAKKKRGHLLCPAGRLGYDDFLLF